MIPFSKPFIGEAEKRGVMEVQDSGTLVEGSLTVCLEENWAGPCEVKHAIATSSDTTLLHIALPKYSLSTLRKKLDDPWGSRT